MAKRARLDEIIGMLREKEEEPEGEVLGNSDTGSLLFPLLFFFFFLTGQINIGICLYCLLFFSS